MSVCKFISRYCIVLSYKLLFPRNQGWGRMWEELKKIMLLSRDSDVLWCL